MQTTRTSWPPEVQQPHPQPWPTEHPAADQPLHLAAPDPAGEELTQKYSCKAPLGRKKNHATKLERALAARAIVYVRHARQLHLASVRNSLNSELPEYHPLDSKSRFAQGNHCFNAAARQRSSSNSQCCQRMMGGTPDDWPSMSKSFTKARVANAYVTS